MDKPSLKALREKYEESLQSPPLGDYNALLGALPALLAIAEAARDAIRNGGKTTSLDFSIALDDAEALAAALALVEE